MLPFKLPFILCILVILVSLCSSDFQKEHISKNYNSRVDTFTKISSGSLYKPVVLVPGVLGSQLEAKLNKSESPRFCDKQTDWFGIWMNLEELLPLVVNCWVDNMRMEYDNATKTVKNRPGVAIRAPDFGGTSAFEYLDTDKYAFSSKYFAPLISHLTTKLGYKHGKDLYGAPFDWRMAPAQHGVFLKNLTHLIEASYYNNNHQKTVLIGHSMGNMFIYYFLQHQSQSWKEKFVDSFVSIAGPYLGSVKAIKAILSGDAEGHDWTLPKLKVRTVLRSSPAFAFMLPRPDLWPHDKKKVVVTLDKNYTVNDYESLFKKIGCEWCWEYWKENGMSLGSLSAPSIPVHCVYSSGIPTSEMLIYDQDLFPDQSPSLIDGSGDGTVNVWSSSACLKWKGQQNEPVFEMEMPGNSHVSILWNSTLHKYLDGVLLK